ncbi:uncharacterized protein TEOVI_000809600 [Trypanosoma equiperdum]|uniref:Uncharacterized protein n=2 Tax=Trypanozoon TaxID=39700 RepID=Q581S4_TRYB2|nr:hypothetical protein, conserved [Trypanosoma brucei brucei TREU927]AAX79896.1 hypothetical protein, conserved [Trypanosoma brucei]AAZ10748.1 hypothetical protein, conserved [Trypanosoma brucei brucei TREU927]SCU67562.1 hypothetical protein, conserved [Trypanosoma equiperdum]
MPLDSPVGVVGRRKDVFLSGLYAVKSNSESVTPNGNGNATDPKVSERLRSWADTISSPLTCTACKLRMRATERTLVYHLTTTYHIEHTSEGCFSFVFPVSACDGTLTSLSARINKKIMMWELVRVVSPPSERPLVLCPAVFDAAAGMEGKAEQEEGERGTLYAVASRASDVLDETERGVGNEIQLEIRWTTKSVRQLTNLPAIVIAYPFACAPCLPEEIVYQTVFSKVVKLVSSANSRDGTQALDWRLRGKYCTVHLSPEDTKIMLKPEDEIFVLTFYFENPMDGEQRDTTTTVVSFVIMVAILLWFLLTKDLEL